MPRKRMLIEVHGVLASIPEHIERTGYDRTTVYNKAKKAGMTLEQYLNTLPEIAYTPYEKPNESPDPFVPGYPWNIKGCENVINAVIKKEFNEMIDAVDLYTKRPTERNRQTVLYHQGWILEAVPNYYDIDPQKIVDEAWKRGRMQARRRDGSKKAQKGLLARR